MGHSYQWPLLLCCSLPCRARSLSKIFLTVPRNLCNLQILSQSPETLQVSVKMMSFLSLELTFLFLSIDFIPLIKVHFEVQKYEARIRKVALTVVSSPESNVKSARQGFRTFLFTAFSLHSCFVPQSFWSLVCQLGPTPSYTGQSSFGYFCLTPAF